MTVLPRLSKPSSVRSLAWLAVVTQLMLQFGLLWYLASQTALCCDATDYYLPAGHSLLHEGLLWQDGYAGYRFYLPALIFGLLEMLARAMGDTSSNAVAWMPYLLAALFFAISSAASIYVFRRDGFRRWALYAVPILLNPLLLAVVPYPLQESIVAAAGIPLLFVLLAHRWQNFLAQCLVAGACVAFITMARPSLFWIAVPIAVFVFYPLMATRKFAPYAARGAVLMLLIVAAAFAPQAYVNWEKFHSLAPIPQTRFEQQQISYGVDMLNYATLHDGATFGPLPVYSPYHALPTEQKDLHFYLDHPREGLFLALVHIWSAFNYISFQPYVPRSQIEIVTSPLLVSSLILALGILGMVYLLGRTEDRPLGLSLALMFLLTCAYVTVAATESRFGLLGFVALSIAAWRVLANLEGRQLCLRAAPLIVGYVCLCLIINALLFYRTGWLWPNAAP